MGRLLQKVALDVFKNRLERSRVGKLQKRGKRLIKHPLECEVWLYEINRDCNTTHVPHC